MDERVLEGTVSLYLQCQPVRSCAKQEGPDAADRLEAEVAACGYRGSDPRGSALEDYGSSPAGNRGVAQEENHPALGVARERRIGGGEDGGEGRRRVCLADPVGVVGEEVHPRTREEDGRKHYERVLDSLYHIYQTMTPT